MPKVNLTERKLQSLSLDTDNYVEYWDKKFSGGSFGVRVSGRTGSKKFILMYRNEDGTRRRMTLGHYKGRNNGGLSVQEARKKANQIIRDVALGEDPAAPKKSNQVIQTFENLANEFLEKHCQKLSQGTVRKYEQQLKKDLLPRWKDKKPDEITRSDVNEVLDHIAYDRESPIASNRTRALIHKLFNFAIERDVIDSNPAAKTEKKGKENSRERVLSEDEISSFWHAIEEETPIMETIYKMLLLTGQRKCEVLRMKWNKVEDHIWTVPSEHAKNNRKHTVPLSTLAQEVLRKHEEKTDESQWVFPSPRKENSNISDNGLQRAVERIRDRCGFYFCNHDLRRTVGSHMASLGVERTVLAKILNHKTADSVVTAIYDRYGYEDEKREALETWSDKLRDIINE